MKLIEVKEILKAEALTCLENLEENVLSACGSDLMSDVLAFSKEKVVMLTGLMNPQVVRTAEMMDIKAIVFVRGKKPTSEILELAEEKGLVILTTDYPMFIACGKLYKNGLGEDSGEDTL